MDKGVFKGNSIDHVATYLFVFIFYAYLISISLPNIYNVDQYFQRFEVTKSIVEIYDLSIPEGSNGIKGIDGRTYSLYGLWWSLLAVPFYAVGKIIGRSPEILVSMLNPLAGAATVTLVFYFAIALGYSRRSSLVVAIFYGLGTFAWPMAKQPFDHIVETLFVLLAIYFMYLHLVKKTHKELVISALCLGVAVNTRLSSILAVPALLFMMGTDCGGHARFPRSGMLFIRKMAIFTASLTPFAFLLLWYNYYRFGSIFETGFQLLASRTGLDFFSGTPLLTGLRGFITSPGKGFFYYSPIALFFFFSFISFYKKHPRLATTFVLLVISYIFFLSKNIYWHGDWAWGPRYLLPITPFLIIPIAALLDSDAWLTNKLALTALVYSVFLLSLAIQFAAVSVHYYNYFLRLRMDKTVSISSIGGIGVPTIYEPPQDMYFDWKRSPILAQFNFIYEIGTRLNNNKFNQKNEIKLEEKRLNAGLPQNNEVGYTLIHRNFEETERLTPFWVYDYWWFYLYILYSNIAGFVVVFILLVICAFNCSQMFKLSRR